MPVISSALPPRTQRGTIRIRTVRPPKTPSGPPLDRERAVTLVAASQAGDPEAFGQLYAAYYDTVFRYVYYRTPRRDLAEDITQDAFVKALRRIDSFSWRGVDFGAWLVTIARNLLADHFKSARVTREYVSSDGEMRDAEESVDGADIEALRAVAAAELAAIVERLNPDQQLCIRLRFYAQLNVAETADAMGKNEGSIKTLQYRAVRNLRRLLQDQHVLTA